MMFDEFLYPAFKEYDSHIWRKKYLWVEEVDYVLKVGIPALKDLYKKFSGKLALPGAPKYMSCLEFEDLIVNSNCLNEKFGSKQLCIMFNLSMMTQVEEIENERHLNMTFIEFIEAVVRVAQNLEIQHLIDDEEMIRENAMEITRDMKNAFAQRPLHMKLESLILIMAKRHLGLNGYNRHK